MRDSLGAGNSRSWDDEVLCINCTWCTLKNKTWRDREGWLNFTFLVIVELRTKKREMRGVGTPHHGKQGLKRMSCASHIPIPAMGGMCPNPACNHVNMRSFQHNHASHFLNCSYSLLWSTRLSSFSSISLFLLNNSTIIAEQKAMSCHYSSRCHNDDVTLSSAYTEYSIHARLCIFPAFSK
jgi:hypothetical protein